MLKEIIVNLYTSMLYSNEIEAELYTMNVVNLQISRGIKNVRQEKIIL